MPPLTLELLPLALCSLLLPATLGDLRPSRVVNTKYGALRGLTRTLSSRTLQQVEVFLGVPYASPPVGYLRFMPPVTPPHWRGIRTAETLKPVCPQRLPDISNLTQSLESMPRGRLEYLQRLLPHLANQDEDCLYLNVYAPIQRKEDSRLPVLVFIHGESYEWNAGNPYDGSVLASYGGVIVVTLNYRLGILGFLPVNDGSARGNYGLMDQVAALHWVQENVVFFGGDSQNITIFGHGHGAACVNLLLISPMSKGLFHRAIMMSGSALSSWAMAKDSLVYTRHMAEVLNCPSEDSYVLIDCLRQKPIEDIMSVNFQVPEYLTAFGPTVDGIVIPEEPLDLMSEPNDLYGQYDLIFGLSRVEVFFHFSAHEEHNGISPERRNRLFRTLVRNLFSYHQFEILLTIINEYTDWTRPNEHPVNILDATADALSDALVTAPLVKAGDLHAKMNPRTYFYVFLHQSENSGFSQRIGCIHGEELLYVFGAPLVSSLAHFPPNYTRSEVALSEAVMTYWINFARHGDPNGLPGDIANDRFRGRFERVVWPKYDVINQKYLAIGMKPKVKSHYHAHRLSFWRHLIPKLHDGGDISEESKYHLLPDHENPTTYDGVVRQVHGVLQETTATSSSTSTTQVSSDPNDSGDIGNASRPLENATTVIPSLSSKMENNGSIFAATVDTTQTEIATKTAGRPPKHGGYSTVLGITIAIGCSLLVLNVLIFVGIYYQHSKTTEWVKLQKSLPEKFSGEGKSSDLKHAPPRTPPPSPEAEHGDIPPYVLSPLPNPELPRNPHAQFGMRSKKALPIVPSSTHMQCSEVKLMSRPPEEPT